MAAASAIALNWGAREAVAAAVALAPNASPLRALTGPAEPPPVLLERGARVLETQVGPPAATLVSWVVEPAAAARGTVVMLHGVRADKHSLLPVGLALSDAGYRVVLVDLRGHGESTGRYLTYGSVEARDLSTLLDGLGRDTGCLGVYGFSYGASVAIQLAAHDPRLRAVVAVAPFSSLREVTGDYERRYLPVPLSLIPDAWFQGAVDQAGKLAAFDPDQAAPVRTVAQASNLLLIHGTADTQVPLHHSQALARAAGPRTELITVPGATHDEMPSDPSGAVRKASIDWFDRFLSSVSCPG